MKSLARITKAYRIVDDNLVREESNASGRAKVRWTNARAVSDQAYFLVIFGQLEDHINHQCEKLLRTKRSSAWPRSRLWDTFDLDRAEFMRKVALLVDKGTTEYRDVKKYYDVRCDLAHGALHAASPVAIAPVVIEFKRLAKQLRSRA